jgi:hypothetical protein
MTVTFDIPLPCAHPLPGCTCGTLTTVAMISRIDARRWEFVPLCVEHQAIREDADGWRLATLP